MDTQQNRPALAPTRSSTVLLYQDVLERQISDVEAVLQRTMYRIAALREQAGTMDPTQVAMGVQQALTNMGGGLFTDGITQAAAAMCKAQHEEALAAAVAAATAAAHGGVAS